MKKLGKKDVSKYNTVEAYIQARACAGCACKCGGKWPLATENGHDVRDSNWD